MGLSENGALKSWGMCVPQRKYDSGETSRTSLWWRTLGVIVSETGVKKCAIVRQLFPSRFRFCNLRDIKVADGLLVVTRHVPDVKTSRFAGALDIYIHIYIYIRPAFAITGVHAISKTRAQLSAFNCYREYHVPALSACVGVELTDGTNRRASKCARTFRTNERGGRFSDRARTSSTP